KGIGAGKEQLRENQAGDGAVEKKVVPLDRSANRACNDGSTELLPMLQLLRDAGGGRGQNRGAHGRECTPENALEGQVHQKHENCADSTFSTLVRPISTLETEHHGDLDSPQRNGEPSRWRQPCSIQSSPGVRAPSRASWRVLVMIGTAVRVVLPLLFLSST